MARKPNVFLSYLLHHPTGQARVRINGKELADHKTRHHGQGRTLYFGPKSQLILTKYLSADPDQQLSGHSPLFAPGASESQRPGDRP